MPEVLYTAEDVSGIIAANIEARGLPKDSPPAAVVHITSVLGEAASGFAELLGELPADQRAFEWMEVIFAGYAEFCARTIPVDQVEG